MLIRYKTEINPNPKQINKIKQTIGVCRFIYNFYISENQKAYKNGEKFITAFSFSKWLNNEFIPNNPNYLWIKDVSSKSVKQSIIYAERAFKRFFNKKTKYPRFKKKNKSNVKMYFVKNNIKDCLCERHRIKIPTLGWVKLKEKGYIPTTKNGYIVKSGALSYQAGRYYISCLIDVEDPPKQTLNSFGLGIDLGLEKFAVVSNGNIYKNINKTNKIRKLEKKLKREQRKLSRKYENKKKIARELLYDFKPWNKITEKSENPTINEILDFIKKSYDSYLEQVQKWQEMIIRNEDYIWEILKANFNEEDVSAIIWNHDHFNVYFYEDTKYDIESYYKDDKMFFNVFDPYLESWSKIYNTINFADLNNAWISLAENLEIGLKPIDN